MGYLFIMTDDPCKKSLISVQDQVTYEHKKYFQKILTLIQIYIEPP